MHFSSYLRVVFRFSWLLIAASCAAASEAEEPFFVGSPNVNVVLASDLVAYASTHAIPVQGIAHTSGDSAPAKGDSVTYVVALRDGSDLQQWLARITADDLLPKERLDKPGFEGLVYSGTGKTWRYPTTRTALVVDFIGPFVTDAKTKPAPVAQHKRIVTSPEFLSYGMDTYCRAQLRIRPLLDTANEKVFIGYSSYPLSPDMLAKGKRAAEIVHLTDEEDRITGGIWFPLGAFVQTASTIPAFEAVLKRVLDMPSLWSMIRHVGVYNSWDFHRIETAHVKSLSDEPAYRIFLNLSLNETLGVKTALTVVAPHPPLQTGAGIVEIYAEQPTDRSKRLFIQLLAASRAASGS